MKLPISMFRSVVVLLAGLISFVARAEEKATNLWSVLEGTTITGFTNTSGHWVSASSLPSVGVTAVRSTGWEGRSSVRAPRSAAFRFFRNGDLSAPLTVRYVISGSAKEAVDYTVFPDGGYRPPPAGVVMIHGREPSRIVIPAGSRSAVLTVEPVDDRIVEGFEKVRVELVYPNPQMYPVASAGTSTDAVRIVFEVRPDYMLQRPRFPFRATIHIVDDDWGRRGSRW